MTWDDIIETVKKLEQLSEYKNIQINNFDFGISKHYCFYIQEYTKYSLIQEGVISYSLIDIYINETNIRLECETGYYIVIEFNEYDIDLYTLKYGRPPESMISSFKIIDSLIKLRI